MRLEELPADILASYLTPYISLDTFQALTLTCRQLHAIFETNEAWNALYHGHFPDQSDKITRNTLPGTVPDWKALFEYRLNARAYFWGYNMDNRLGSLLGELPEEYRSSSRRGICRPYRSSLPSDVKVADVDVGGFSIGILSTGGKIYVFGNIKNSPGFSTLRAINRRNQGNNWSGLAPAGCAILEPSSERFVRISCGREHILAITADGRLFSWTESVRDPGRELKFSFDSSDIASFSAGWDLSTAIVRGMGLVVWKRNQNSSVVLHSILPVVPALQNQAAFATGNVKPAVLDVAGGNGFLAYINGDGHVFVLLVPNGDIELGKKPVQLDIRDEDGSQVSARLLKAGLNRILVLSTNGTVHEIKRTGDDFAHRYVQGLESEHIVDIAAGDYHNLALTEEGKIVSWGLESQGCGSLGQGTRTEMIEAGTVEPSMTINIADISTFKPGIVKMDGAYRIAAGGWQSAAIEL